MSLKIHAATYGLGHGEVGDMGVDVTERVRSLVKDNSLDIVVNNATLTPNQNPYRGKRKYLCVIYSYDGSGPVTVTRTEKDWLIIGQVQRSVEVDGLTVETTVDYNLGPVQVGSRETAEFIAERDGREGLVTPAEVVQLGNDEREWLTVGNTVLADPPCTTTALNDFLVRKFQISERRLRGPMPIELRDFHRDDLAKLYAELGFTKGAEIGVAEGHYSEILLKANPTCELLLIDPWRRYDGNPWAHSQEHQDFSLSETRRKTAGYNVKFMRDYSMNAVREVLEDSLDFAYIDGHHGFDWVMQDLIEWSKRVRSGGIVSGDDYYHFKRHWAGVVEAVNAYTQAHQVGPWFLCDAPRSVDFFWVKL